MEGQENVRPAILICMATYNGGEYIEQQLSSLARQTCQDFLLLVHDDGSTDETFVVLKKWEQEQKISMYLLDDGIALHDSSRNFAHILSWAEQELGEFMYYMFCDQDDVWKEDKIERTLEKMKQAEQECGGSILVHTDLEVVDEKLHSLSPSYLAYRSINPYITDVNRILIQNNVTGCTMLWNRKLNRLLKWENTCPAMHDWWISLTAALFGHIVFLNETTILYRQHEKNVVGATKVNSLAFIWQRLSNLKYVKMKFRQSVRQAQDILAMHGGACSKKNRIYLEQFSRLYTVGKLKRLYLVIKYRFFKQSPIQIIGELLFL